MTSRFITRTLLRHYYHKGHLRHPNFNNVPLFRRLCYVKLKLLLIAIEYKSDQRESR